MLNEKDKQINEISRRLLYLETLETCGSDNLDFSNQAVWSIKAGLEAAYEAGSASANCDALKSSLSDILSRFKSCIGAGGRIEGDKEAIKAAEALLAKRKSEGGVS
jgi:hypothetical protein